MIIKVLILNIKIKNIILTVAEKQKAESVIVFFSAVWGHF